MYKCDICGKEMNGPGFIIGHIKDNVEVDVVLCNECVGTLYCETLKELMKKGKSDEIH